MVDDTQDRDAYDGQRPSTAVERLIAAEPRHVWPLITDIDVPARFSSEYRGGEWLDGARGPRVGARFRGHNRNDYMGAWHTTSQVIECDEPSRYAWVVSDPDRPNSTWRFLVTQSKAGTRIRFEVVLGPGPSGLTAVIGERPHERDALIGWRLRDLRRNMQTVVDGIAGLAEAAARSSD